MGLSSCGLHISRDIVGESMYLLSTNYLGPVQRDDSPSLRLGCVVGNNSLTKLAIIGMVGDGEFFLGVLQPPYSDCFELFFPSS